MGEDVHLTQVGGPERYAREAASTVDYVSVSSPDGAVGFLWFSDAEGAAGFAVATSGGPAAHNAGVVFSARLLECKLSGLSPSAAIVRIAELASGDDRLGVDVADARNAPNSSAVRALAKTS